MGGFFPGCFKDQKERLLITTTIGLMLGTGAFAQSPSEQPKTNSPRAAQNQTTQIRRVGGVSVDYFFFAQFGVRPEYSIDAFRGSDIGDHEQPVGPEHDEQ